MIASHSRTVPARPTGARVALLGEVGHRDSDFSVGGTGIGLIRLARGLIERDWRVDLVTASSHRLTAYGEPLPAAAVPVDLGGGGRLSQVLRLLGYIARCRPALVVAQDSRAIDIALAVRRLSPYRYRLVCALHNQANLRYGDKASGSERRKMRRFRRIAKRADAVLTVSPGMLEAASARLGPDFRNGFMIPNPAYRRELAEAAMLDPVYRPIPEKPHLLWVGRLSQQKDPATLLRAVAGVVHEHRRPVQLTMLGEGPLRGEVERQVADLGLERHVHMPGFVPNPMAYMADTDMLVLSSEHEAFGYVLVEALGMGLPIVSTDCPHGPAYVLDNGRYGRLVPIRDPERMAAAIVETLDAPPDREHLIRRAREFGATPIAERYAGMFRQLLGNTAKGRLQDDAH